MSNKKDIFEILEENTMLETKYEFVSKQNKDLTNKIAELENIILTLENEKENQQKFSEKNKQELTSIIYYLNEKYDLKLALEPQLEIVDLSELFNKEQ